MATTYDDTISITTPEGVEVELTLAGIGSRFISDLLDLLIKMVGFIAAAGITIGGGFGTAVFTVLASVVFFAYDIFFETLNGGRTPGKAATGIRVVDVSGGPVRALPSTIRNLVRVVDILPGFYGVGVVAILISRRNQRLGDVAGGTLVVRDRHGGRPEKANPPVAAAMDTVTQPAVGWDVAGVTDQELVTVRSYLARRDGLEREARYRIARGLTDHLRPKVPGADIEAPPDVFLERLAATKAARGDLPRSPS